jgi:cytochrome c oxidase cbb3-type subunit II
VHLLNPRDLVPESNMPAFPWLAEAPVDAGLVEKKLRRLAMLGDPYTEEDFASITGAVEGRTELDALVAYLQGLGRNAPKGR